MSENGPLLGRHQPGLGSFLPGCGYDGWTGDGRTLSMVGGMEWLTKIGTLRAVSVSDLLALAGAGTAMYRLQETGDALVILEGCGGDRRVQYRAAVGSRDRDPGRSVAWSGRPLTTKDWLDGSVRR